MGKFDGYLLVSDFDGTLIGDDHRISAANIAAIDAFIANGGRFLGATGRSELNIRPYTKEISLSSPWILYNGAAIFDWRQDEFIYTAPLDRAMVEAFARRVMASISDINIQVYTGGPYSQVNPRAVSDSHAVQESQHYYDRPMEDIGEDWIKILFCSDRPNEIDDIEAMFSDDRLHLHAHKTRSGARYFELTALGVNKGSALARLRNILKPRPTLVVAIGDYMNDVEMLFEADISAAPATAIQAVKDQAQIITAGHNNSAIADLIKHLDRRLEDHPEPQSPPKAC